MIATETLAAWGAMAGTLGILLNGWNYYQQHLERLRRVSIKLVKIRTNEANDDNPRKMFIDFIAVNYSKYQQRIIEAEYLNTSNYTLYTKEDVATILPYDTLKFTLKPDIHSLHMFKAIKFTYGEGKTITIADFTQSQEYRIAQSAVEYDIALFKRKWESATLPPF